METSKLWTEVTPKLEDQSISSPRSRLWQQIGRSVHVSHVAKRLMWAKQSHKPPMWEWLIQPIHGDLIVIWGMVYHP